MAGERRLQAGVRANPQATLLHLLWPEPKSSLSSSKQEATAELHDTRTQPERAPLLLPPANRAVNTCRENTCVCQGAGTLLLTLLLTRTAEPSTLLS